MTRHPSKSAQAVLLRSLGVPTPRCIVFNDLDALRTRLNGWTWPALLKPEQGGSGARMYFLTSYEELCALLESRPGLWLPDNLLLLQQYFPHDESRGILRMEFLGGELLYAMRVVSHGAFNLCPSELCNPFQGSQGPCVRDVVTPRIPQRKTAKGESHTRDSPLFRAPTCRPPTKIGRPVSACAAGRTPKKGANRAGRR